jgi:hypothetical protein
MSLSPEGRRERARVGALSRSRSPNDPDLVGARRALAADRLVQHVRTDADKLTDAQRQEAVALLAGAVPAREERAS